MLTDWRDYVVSTPNILHGKPRIKDTRIPVSIILAYLSSGKSPEEIILDYPDLSREHIWASLDYARELTDYDIAI